jgi:hypothetical protein
MDYNENDATIYKALSIDARRRVRERFESNSGILLFRITLERWFTRPEIVPPQHKEYMRLSLLEITTKEAKLLNKRVEALKLQLNSAIIKKQVYMNYIKKLSK